MNTNIIAAESALCIYDVEQWLAVLTVAGANVFQSLGKSPACIKGHSAMIVLNLSKHISIINLGKENLFTT